jgi:hypothetical protein
MLLQLQQREQKRKSDFREMMEANKQLSSTQKVAKKSQAETLPNYAELYENEKYEEYLKDK